MKNIKNSAVAEKSLAAHRLLKIKSTEDKSYQISAENCLRKRDWYGLVHFSQRKRCGNAAETRNATSFCSYVFPPSGNVTETWTIRFPQDFRNTETPYFTLCNKTSLLNICLGCLSSSSHDRFRKREISHSGKCPLRTLFFSRIRIRQAKTLTNSLAQSS